MTAHALLAPSAAARWMACPGSVRLSEGRDDGGSVYAREGTAAHLLARHCLETGTDAAEHLDYVIGPEGFATGAADGDVAFAVTAEMVDAVQIYVDAVRPYTTLEDHLIEGTLATPIPGCWGTVDFGAYDAATRRLTVGDFKFGKGVIVEATGNKQLLTYAAALLPGCDAVDEIELVIVQPRRLHRDGPVRQAIHTRGEIESHVAAARRAAALIERDPPILNAGDHCRFCRATTFCSAFLNITRNDRPPERSQLQNCRGMENEKESQMSKFKDQLIDASNRVETLTAVEKTGDNPWLAYGEAAKARNFVGELLKFNKGDYLAGQNNREIPIGTRLIANMDSLEIGWVRWENGRREPRMGRIVDGFVPARRAELGDNDRDLWPANDDGEPRDPWQFTNNLVLAAETDGELFTFTTDSNGGRDAIGKLCTEYGKELHRHPDDWPIIELDGDSYLHSNKQRGRIKFPILKIVSWSPKDGEAPAPSNPNLAPKLSKPAASARI
jgi:hypothetical protein